MRSRKSTVCRLDDALYAATHCRAQVIQELMQTDLHRVIRTQHLTDDHCQVCVQEAAGKSAPILIRFFILSIIVFFSPAFSYIVLCLPGSPRLEIYSQRGHRSSRSQACQSTTKCQLRSQGVRLRPCAEREDRRAGRQGGWAHDRVRRDALVPRT
jgi:hypothetical protein